LLDQITHLNDDGVVVFEIVAGALTSPPFLPHPPAHVASLSPATKTL